MNSRATNPLTPFTPALSGANLSDFDFSRSGDWVVAKPKGASSDIQQIESLSPQDLSPRQLKILGSIIREMNEAAGLPAQPISALWQAIVHELL